MICPKCGKEEQWKKVSKGGRQARVRACCPRKHQGVPEYVERPALLRPRSRLEIRNLGRSSLTVRPEEVKEILLESESPRLKTLGLMLDSIEKMV